MAVLEMACAWRLSSVVTALLALVAIGLGCGKSSPSSGSPAPTTRAHLVEERVVGGEGIAWGQVGKNGLVVGLRVEGQKVRVGELLPYWIAVDNRGQEERRIVLFNDLDAQRRMHLYVRRADGTEKALGVAAGLDEPSTGDISILMVLGPGQKKERTGKPIRVRTDLTGRVDFFVRFGGPSYSFDQRSGVVSVDVLPAL